MKSMEDKVPWKLVLVNLFRGRKKSSKILFSCVGGDVYLKLSDIRLIETSGHKNTIWLEKESYQIYKKMDDLAMQLKGYGFLRIHKSFLVNMEYIRQISNYILTMEDGRQLPIPKAKYKQVRQEYTLECVKVFL